MAFRVII